MSFEGHYQRLCTEGHYWPCDVYAGDTEGTLPCGHPIAWWNTVDETNGCSGHDPEHPAPCECGMVDLVIAEHGKHAYTCESCGHREDGWLPIYEIPTDQGHAVPAR